MAPSATSFAKLTRQSGVRRLALGHGTRAFLLSLAVVVLGGGPSFPLALTNVMPRSSFAAAAATTADIAIAAADHTTTNKQPQADTGEEEHGLYSSYDGRSSSTGRPLGLERNLSPEVVDEETEIEMDDPRLVHDSSGSDLGVLLEGCALPAEATSVRVRNDKPTKGNVAENAIDGDPKTW